ncbi:MAG: hypothetical protein ACKOQM_03380 [Novosphingobium sp.]
MSFIAPVFWMTTGREADDFPMICAAIDENSCRQVDILFALQGLVGKPSGDER